MKWTKKERTGARIKNLPAIFIKKYRLRFPFVSLEHILEAFEFFCNDDIEKSDEIMKEEKR